MLKAINIEAWPVLANAERQMDPAMPSPGEFNHLLTVVPRGRSAEEWIWLDTTPGVAPYRMLLSNLRDRNVLLVSPPKELKQWPGVTHVLRTPADPPFAMSAVTEVTGKIDTLGAIRAAVRMTFRGDAEVVLRSVLLNVPADQLIEVAKGIAEEMKLDGNVSDFKATNLEAPGLPLSIEFSIRRGGFFKWTATGATLSLPLEDFELPYATDKEWKTRTRGKLGSPVLLTSRAILELPAGYTPALPVGIKVARDGYAFHSAYRIEEGRVVVERTVQIKKPEILATAAPEYLSFVRTVRSDEAQKIELTFDTKAAAEIPPDATAVELYSAGFDAFQNNRYEVALAYWNGVVKLAPKHDSVWDALGLAYEKLGRPADAVNAFRKQTEESPYHHQAFKDLARVLIRQNEHDAARKALLKHVEIVPLDGGALSDLGSSLIDAGEHAQAAVHLEKAVAISKNDAWSHVRLGAAYAGLKAPDKARAAFERAIKISPSPGIWTYAGWHLAQQGIELPWAEDLCRKTLTQVADTMNSLNLAEVTDGNRDDVERVGWSWDAVGWIHFQRGNAELAERYIRAAWMLMGEPEMMDHLGQIYEKQARLADAAGAYVTALSLNQSSKPVAERARRILGEKTDLKDLLAAAPGASMNERPVTLIPASPVDGAAQVEVLLKPDGSVADARFERGDEAIRTLVASVRTTRFKIQFPDDVIGQLLSTVGVRCRSNPSECGAGVLPVRSRWN
jgi:Flp pilus assembly protein TadD